LAHSLQAGTFVDRPLAATAGSAPRFLRQHCRVAFSAVSFNAISPTASTDGCHRSMKAYTSTAFEGFVLKRLQKKEKKNKKKNAKQPGATVASAGLFYHLFEN
jgi:hypothetical protein